MAGYGQPYGAPPQGYGAPPGAPQYGAPPGAPQYGAPPGQPQYGGAPQYGAPPPGAPPRGGAPPPGGYYPPQGQHPYGGPPPQIMPPAPPPQQDPMFQHFQQVAGADQKLSAMELQEVLKRVGLGDYPRPGFTFQAETCRQMIAMLDVDGDMSLDFAEFRTLYAALDAWKATFQRHDADRSGSVEHRELAAVIQEMGFNMTPAAVNVCVKRYSFKGNDQVAFDDFVACAIRVRALSNAFRAKDAQGRGFMQNISYDDFMQMVLKL